MATKKAGTFYATVRKWMYNKSGFNKYGLKAHDCLYETEEVKEALRRLPQNIQDERNFRLIRAMQLSLQKTYLPQEQWQRYEDDDYYLDKHLKEVQAEFAEKKEWAKK